MIKKLDCYTILLDTQSQIHLFNSKSLVKNIRKTPFPIKVTGISSESINVDTIADTDDFGVVYYSPKATANILSYALLEKECTITAIKHKKMTVGFDVDNNSTHLHYFFKQRARLFTYNCSTLPSTSRVYVNRVSSRKRRYTSKQVKRAELAHLIRERLGWPSTATLKRLINSSAIHNLPITSMDVDRDLDIFGRSYADAAGKFTYRPTPHTLGEKVCDDASKLVEDMKNTTSTLYCDLFFAGGLVFLISVSRPLDYCIISLVKSRTWINILQAIEEHKNVYIKHGWNNVKHIRFDNEKGVERIRNLLATKLELHLETSAPYQHVPIVEAKIRRVKERCRCQIAHLGYKMNRTFLAYLPRYVARRLNICPSNINGVNVSPYEILTGQRVDYKKELRIGFGELAYVHNRTTKPINSVDVERAKLCICLGISSNSESSVLFFDLAKRMTQQITVADNFTTTPMPDDVVIRLNHIAEVQHMPDHLMDLDEDDQDDQDDQDNHAETPTPSSTQDNVTIADDINENEFVRSSGDAETLKITDIDQTPLSNNFMDSFEENDDSNDTDPDDEVLDIMPDPDQPLRGGETPQDIGEAANHNTADDSANNQEHRYFTRSTDGTLKRKVFRLTVEDSLFKHKVVHHISMQAGIKRHKEAAYDSILNEISAVEGKQTFLPLNANELTYKQRKAAIRSFIFMKEKFDAEGTFLKLKSRLTANGSQQDRVYIENSFGSVSSPTLAMSSMMTILSIAKSESRFMATIDVGSAYLNADMSKEDVIMILDKTVAEQYVKVRPEVANMLNEKGELYVKLQKALYGSLQASKLWYDNISSFLIKNEYVANKTDTCVFNKWVGDKCITVGIYVDDLLITATVKKLIKQLKDALIKEYKEVNYIDGDKITYLGMLLDNSHKKYISITMPQFIDDIISDMQIGKDDVSNTPASTKLFNILDNDELLSDDERERFHTNVAKLLYLGKRARPDILLAATFLCTRVRSPGKDDLKKLNRCARYLNKTKKTIDYRINATKDMLEMCVYVDASFAVHDTFRSHSGAVLTIGRNTVIYTESLKQKLNAKSSTEAELIAISDVLPQIIANRNFLEEQLRQTITLNLFQDNKSTMALIKNGRPLAKSTRHINIRFFFISDYSNRNEITIHHLTSEKMIADFYTKPLQGELFRKHRDAIMGQVVNAKKVNTLCCAINRIFKRLKF